MKTKKITVAEKSPNLAAALADRIAEKFPRNEITIVSRVGETSAADIIGGLGIPSYVPGTGRRKVISVGTKMTKDEAERKAQWEIIRNPESTKEEILEQLDRVEVYTISNERGEADFKLALYEHQTNIQEAEMEGDEEAKLAAYKTAFKFLMANIV